MNVPSTIDECITTLNEKLPFVDRVYIMNLPKDDLVLLHHGLGRWIRNNWRLWEPPEKPSPLRDYMSSLGFQHPDDMSQAIIVEYWSRLNNQPSQWQEDIAHSIEYWKSKGPK